ncbi:TPA: host cell division inhibitor Icd-like protein [Haemophilus influenzae]
MPYRLWLANILIILPVLSNLFTTSSQNGIISPQSEKVIASREKLNLYKANDSTPQNRAFFVRDIRTPQNKLRILFQHLSTIYSSMVERNEPSMTGCLPCMAVSHLVTFYRPTVRSLAVVPENLYKDTAEMIYKFLCVNRTQSHFNLCVISLNSTTEKQARLSLSADYRFIAVVARINPQNNRTFSTNGNNHRLPKCEDVGSIESTETKDGNRNRHLSGIFLPKIHSLHVPEKSGALSYIEFAVRATHGNKALCTNNVGYSLVAVEPLSHPITGDNSLLTKPKRNPTMKIYPKNNRTLAALPTLFVSAEMEVAHA